MNRNFDIDNPKQIKEIRINFEERRVKCIWLNVNGTVVFEQSIKFALSSPFGLIAQGLRKLIFGELKCQ